MRDFRRNQHGSATKWFALAAVVLSAGGMMGAHGLAWLSQPGRISLVAYRTPAAAVAETPTAMADPGVDRTPTGSIPSSGLVVRIR